MSSTRPDLKFADTGDERQYYRKYSNLPPKESTTIRIIDHNNKDYFTALDEDADLIADNIYKTQSVVKYNQTHKNKYVTISPQVFTNNVLRFCLIDNNYKVEIYNSKTFQIVTMATPGNLENLSNEYGINLENMIKDFSSPMIAGIKYQQVGSLKKIGICLIDLLNNNIQVSEFDDNDLFSNLESLLLQLGVKEVILPSNYDPQDENNEVIKLYQVLDKIGGIVISSVKSSLFTNKDIEQDLGKFITTTNEANNIEVVLGSKGISSIEYSLSFSCCNALLHYLDLFTQESPNFTIDKYNLSSFMKLDLSTMKALNIFPTQSSSSNNLITKSSNVTSIFELLNKCKTSVGSRLLSQWLKQPLTNLVEINERHLLVNHLMEDTNLRVFLSQDWLPQIPDVKRLLKKISNGIKKTVGNENKKLEDVIRLYQLVLVLPQLIDHLSNIVGEENNGDDVKLLIKKYWLDPVSKNYESLIKYQELVETTIDLSPLESSSAHDLLNTDFNIKPEFDESLIAINDNLQATLSNIKNCHIEVSEDLGIELEKKLKLEKHQQHGWCFRVTRNDSSVLRNTGNNYIELQTVKAGVFFTSKSLRSLSEKYQEFSGEYNSKQRELIKEILSITSTYQLVFTSLSLTLGHLDVLASFANVAIFAPIPYVKPMLHPLSSSIESDEHKQRKIKLEEARHPVLEVQDDINFIANDVYLSTPNAEADSKGKPFVIITGPNMGGKSTYIRQVGVIALMSQVGSFVPASEDSSAPEIPIFDAILSRVGAGDSQLKGLSTFMIEMLETSSILATATHNSLIIVDELGRGTSTYDGFGLAWSILEHLISEKHCFTLFATHFHELTELATKYNDKVSNLHVVAHVEKNDEQNDENEDDITLMYKVEPGISDKSFGIHVAELVKFPNKIVNMAKRKASELQNSNSIDEDQYIQNKRTKCSGDEITSGINNLKEILKKWKTICYDSDSKCNVESEEAVQILKKLVNEDYAGTIQNDKYINEVLSML